MEEAQLRTKDDNQGDGELVQQMRGGDRDAFTALVGRYRDIVYAAALSNRQFF